jgi:hypothetical protein
MEKETIPQIWRNVFVSSAIVLFCFIFAQLFVSVVVSIAPESISKNIYTAESIALSDIQIRFLKILQSVAALITFILPSFLIARFVYKNTVDTLLLKLRGNVAVYGLSALVLISAVPFMNVIISWNAGIKLPTALELVFQAMEEAAVRSTEIMLSGTTVWALLINIVLIALIPAVGEELFFRGLLQGLIKRYTRNSHLAVFMAAFIFSAIHFQFYGFVPRFLLGIFFGYLVVYSKSIWIAVWAHFLNNAMAVVAYYIVQQRNIAVDVEEIGTRSQDILYLVFSVVLTIGLLYFLFRKREREL